MNDRLQKAIDVLESAVDDLLKGGAGSGNFGHGGREGERGGSGSAGGGSKPTIGGAGNLRTNNKGFAVAGQHFGAGGVNRATVGGISGERGAYHQRIDGQAKSGRQMAFHVSQAYSLTGDPVPKGPVRLAYDHPTEGYKTENYESTFQAYDKVGQILEES